MSVPLHQWTRTDSTKTGALLGPPKIMRSLGAQRSKLYGVGTRLKKTALKGFAVASAFRKYCLVVVLACLVYGWFYGEKFYVAETEHIVDGLIGYCKDKDTVRDHIGAQYLTDLPMKKQGKQGSTISREATEIRKEQSVDCMRMRRLARAGNLNRWLFHVLSAAPLLHHLTPLFWHSRSAQAEGGVWTFLLQQAFNNLVNPLVLSIFCVTAIAIAFFVSRVVTRLRDSDSDVSSRFNQVRAIQETEDESGDEHSEGH